MANLKVIFGVGAEEFVNGTGGAGEFGVVIIVDDDNSLFGKARMDELKAGFDGAIKIAITEGKSDFVREILGLEIVEPGFFNDDSGVTEVGWVWAGLVG